MKTKPKAVVLDVIETCFAIAGRAIWPRAGKRPRPVSQPDELALIAAHDWDIDGASKAGLTTGYLARQQPRGSTAMAKPNASGTTLGEVAAKLLG